MKQKDTPPILKTGIETNLQKEKRIVEIQGELAKSRKSRGKNLKKISDMIDTLSSAGTSPEKIDSLRKAMPTETQE